MQENWRWMVYPCLFVGLVRMVFELLHFRNGIADSLYLLLAGPVLGVQLMSLFALIGGGAISWVTHTTLVEALERRWVSETKRKRPGESFAIPYWPFRIVAAILAVGMFVILMGAWTLLVFALPNRLEPINDALVQLYPLDE